MHLLKIEDVAAKLRMSKSGVRRLLKLKKLPKAIILGDCTHVWNEATIDAWLDSKERGSMSIHNLPHD